jgi:uncharacterized membrane protein
MDDYPLLHLLWSMLLIFGFVIWFWLLITVFSDLFRRHDISGGKKVLWIILLFATSFIGILIYLIVNGHGMAERNAKQMQQAQKQFDDHVKEVAGGSAAVGAAVAAAAAAAVGMVMIDASATSAA